MKKLTKIVLIMTVSGMIGLMGCKKNENYTENEAKNKTPFDKSSIAATVMPPIGSAKGANSILRWIAIGVADQGYKTTNFKTRMHNYLDNAPKKIRSNGFLQTEFLNTYNHDFEDVTNQRINTNFPTNDYDRTMFYGFSFQKCDWTINVGNPILDFEDINKPLVVCWQSIDNCDDDNDDFFGYFINSAGTIDSVHIIVGDNDDDYYKWFITASGDCDTKSENTRMGGYGECNNNGKCEPWLGETFANCVDCALNGTRNLSNLKFLFLHSVTYNADKKKDQFWPHNWYVESAIGGNYEFMFNYFVYDSLAQDLKTQFALVDYNFNSLKFESEYKINDQSNNFSTEYPFLDILPSSAPSAQQQILQCKKKKNGTYVCNHGITFTKVYDVLMTELFDPPTDRVAFSISEMDRGNFQNFNDIASAKNLFGNLNVYTITPTRSRSKNRANLRLPYTAASGVSFTSGPLSNIPSGKSITSPWVLSRIDPNAGWVLGAPINNHPTYYLTIQNPDNDEMSYTFAYSDK